MPASGTHPRGLRPLGSPLLVAKRGPGTIQTVAGTLHVDSPPRTRRSRPSREDCLLTHKSIWRSIVHSAFCAYLSLVTRRACIPTLHTERNRQTDANCAPQIPLQSSVSQACSQRRELFRCGPSRAHPRGLRPLGTPLLAAKRGPGSTQPGVGPPRMNMPSRAC